MAETATAGENMVASVATIPYQGFAERIESLAQEERDLWNNMKCQERLARRAKGAYGSRLISRSSYFAILRGEMNLREAKNLGYVDETYIWEDTEGKKVSRRRAAIKKAPKLCLCGCGHKTKGGLWKAGHDARRYSLVDRLRGLITAVDEVHPPMLAHLIEKNIKGFSQDEADALANGEPTPGVKVQRG